MKLEELSAKKSIDFERQYLSFEASPETINEDSYTMKAIVGVHGFEVKRFSWSLGEFILKLDFKNGLNLSRAEEGAMPLLYDHEQNIGIVSKAWLDGDNLTTELHFTKEDELAVRTFRRFKEKTIRKFSFGFSVGKLTLVELNDETGIHTYGGSDIQVFEVTATGMPANPKTYALSQNKSLDNKYPCQVSLGEFQTMTQPAVSGSQPQINSEEKTISVENVMYLSKMKTLHNLPEDFYMQLLSMDKSSKADLAQLVLDYVSDHQTPPPVTSGVTLVTDETDRIIPLITDALTHRYCPQQPKLTKLASDNKFTRFSFMDCARYILSRNGRDLLGVPNHEIYRLIQGREDFAAITNNFANRVLLEGYSSEPKSYLPFTRVRQTQSFGTNLVTRAARAPLPRKIVKGIVPEGLLGPDEIETYRIFAYSVLMVLEREALVSDDLGQFSADVWAYGQQTNLLESNLVYSQIINNPVMASGKNLFDAAHKNIGSGQALGEEGLSAAREAIRTQLDGSGNRLNLIMRNIVVGSSLETIAEKLTYADVVPSNTADVNPFARSTKRIVDSVMDDNPDCWFATAASSQTAIVELAYLQGQEGPYIMSDTVIGIDGKTFRYGIDVGAKVIDFRGIWINKIPAKKIQDPSEK